MSVCEYLIGKDIAANCSNLIRPGVEQLGYIINKGDIESFTVTEGVVESIVLKTGKNAHLIQQVGQQPFNGTSTEMQEGDFVNSFIRVVAFVVLDNSPAVARDIIEPLANGEFVVIIENKYKDDTTKNAFEIIGLETGARASAISQNKYENQSAWSVELTESESSVAQRFVWKNNYTETKAMLDALLES